MSERLIGIEEQMEAFWEKKGMTEDFKLFSESEECKAIIDEAFKTLMVLYEKMKEGAPEFVVERIERQIYKHNEDGKDVFASDVVQSFKITLFVAVEMKAETVDEEITPEMVVESLTSKNYEVALKFLKQISIQMLEMIPMNFIDSIRKDMIANAFANGMLNVSVGFFNPESGGIEIQSLDDFLRGGDSDQTGEEDAEAPKD